LGNDPSCQLRTGKKIVPETDSMPAQSNVASDKTVKRFRFSFSAVFLALPYDAADFYGDHR
jgi:hypothetical protein